DVPVVLRGETGVGKEVLAREIHARSPRAQKPLLKINCAAVPLELLESELFGYERGAFTGALKSTPGKFETADGGTILLDEIGDMDFKLQAKLLHVLQDGEFQRLGGRETIRVDVRILAATHCDLERAVQEGRFREDLFYRLNVISLAIPPLRERKDEIVP
ncbi:MAG TPA: sigma-54 factor interaction domain-containing protein, partial [Bryobacteraceae bacterium]|nr:sigma-54 factor interaction domain-containing protein [Bryobacteraceae bacterium]